MDHGAHGVHLALAMGLLSVEYSWQLALDLWSHWARMHNRRHMSVGIQT